MPQLFTYHHICSIIQSLQMSLIFLTLCSFKDSVRFPYMFRKDCTRIVYFGLAAFQDFQKQMLNAGIK